MGALLSGPVLAGLFLITLTGSVVWCISQKLYKSLSWRGIIFCALPGIIMVLLFYALAIHMYTALGGWPKSIGEAGFPPALLKNANITFLYFELMFLSMIFIWPAAMLICSVFARWRKYIAHLSLFGASFVICFIIILLAPSQFLYWWWD